jgi:hypothetical protein
MKPSLTSFFIAIPFLIFSGCQKKESEQVRQQTPQTLRPPPSSSSYTAAGVRWNPPQRWSQQPERPMRVATYSVPSAQGDPEGGECAVFYFGAGQGGTIDDNINRWIGQFENGATHSRSLKDVNAMKVSFVQINGTYLSPAGPMMQTQGKKSDYRLLGAIVQAPQGLVFFKLTGPAKTVAAAESEFNGLIESVAKLEPSK